MSFTGRIGSPLSMPGSVVPGYVEGTLAVGDRTYAPEVHAGIPMIGAPFFHGFTEQIVVVSMAPAPPTPGTMNLQVYAPEITVGPQLRGAPWSARIYVEPFPTLSPALQPATPPGVTPDVKGKPFLERVPDTSGPNGLNRLRRHTEKLSIIINSLVAQDILQQIGPSSWTIDTAGGSGLTGTFP